MGEWLGLLLVALMGAAGSVTYGQRDPSLSVLNIMGADIQTHGCVWLNMPLGGKVVQTECGWGARVHNGRYVVAGPRVDCVAYATWPKKRRHGATWRPEPVRLSKWIALGHRGGLCKEQQKFDYELEHRRPRELIVSHLCGNSMCIRPAHLVFQTRTQDARDREWHMSHRGSIRPDAHLHF